MDILLNLHHSKESLFLFTAAISCALSLVMALSFFLSKKFVNLELDKLEKMSSKFERLIILASGAILSMITVVIGVVFVSTFARGFYAGADEICSSYMKLMVVFSVILITSYTLTAPNHSKLRLVDVPDKEARYICDKFFRIAVVSFVITMVSHPIISVFKDTEHNLFFEYLSIGTIIVYYFLEMMFSEKKISDLLNIRKINQHSMSAKLATFINNKFMYLSLICMLYAVVVNYSRYSHSDVMLFTHLNSVYLFLFQIFAFQSIVVFVINKFLLQLESLEIGNKSKRAVLARKENLIWICDILVLVAYFFVLCLALQYAGIDLKKYIFHDNLVTISAIAFITTIIYKGFHEFKDAILEKAEVGDEYYAKFKTFMPALSAVFYTILFVISSLIILSNLGINITPILAAFSIFSAAVGLAAKDIIQAFLQGLTLLVEKNLYVGEVVNINGMLGVIEKLSVRVIQIRDVNNGSIHIIPYNYVNSITNYSKDYSCRQDSLRLSSSKDVGKACKILGDLIDLMKKEDKYQGKILGDLKIHGVKPFDLMGVQVFWEIKTTPDAVGADFTYDLYTRLVDKFNKAGIEIPITSNISLSV